MIIPANFGSIIKRTAVDEAYTVLPSDDYVVAVDDAVLTLPAVASVPAGWTVLLANADVANNTVTVEPVGDDTIGGVAQGLTLATTAAMVQLVGDGVDNWESIRPGT